MVRKNTRSNLRRSTRKNKSGRRKRGGSDLLTPLLLLGAQQLYARSHCKKSKSRRHRSRRGRSRRRR